MKNLFLILLFFSPLVAYSEPWLSTRFAQNCAGCHAPGRKNLEPMDRRCSLSCQGCHANPNGGGLRSHYGKWNENRWLKSYYSQSLSHKKPVAPYHKQRYVIQAAKGNKNGFPLIEQHGHPFDETDFEREGNEFIISKSRAEFEYQVPQDDPYRLMLESKVDGGGDFRFVSYKVDGQEAKNFFMSGDFAIRYRPFYKKLHLVYEARFLGNPNTDILDYEKLIGTERTRSAYVLVDDMPYNIFAMYGYYRPLFGQVQPDHTHLLQKITSFTMTGSPRSQILTYEAVSVGTAPNVPYLNVHAIGKRKYGDEEDDTAGYALNAGMRFVTLGGSVNYSLWSTESSKDLVNMHSLSGGIQLWRLTLNGEVLLLNREAEGNAYESMAYGIDAYARAWREHYLTSSIAKADTSLSLQEGSSSQLRFGLRSFLIPGLDLSALYSIDQDESPDGTYDSNSYIMQVHSYF